MRITNPNTIDWVRWSYWALWFNAFWAAMGSWYLLGRSDPMPLKNLADTPFSTYDGPGWILLLAVGGTSLLAAIWRGAKLPYATELTLVAGVTLLSWLLFEFWWMPQYWPPQLLFALVAAVMIMGGWSAWKQHPRAGV